MTTDEVRSKYLKFFEARGHKVIPPAPLVLENDPTTLFTSSGMQPLVPYLLGEPHPEGKRVVDSQPAIRTGDIDEVGDNRHLTLLEMIGNWSFGDYFKKEQIPWIFEYLTDDLEIDPNKLFITVFRGREDLNIPRDDEAVEIWKEVYKKKGIDAKDVDFSEKNGMGDGRIFYYDDKKNWWSRSGTPDEMPIGEPGGPSSELFYDFGQERKLHENSKFKNEPCHVNCDCGRFIEIGNNVFMTYIKRENGFEPLKNKNIDFGGGLERLVAVTNNDPDVFTIDIFQSMISLLEDITQKKYADNQSDMRIIADHIRAADALAQNNVIPANKLQGYVMRRLIRRAAVKMKSLKGNVSGKDFEKLTDKNVIVEEVEKFNKTLNKGLNKLEKDMRKYDTSFQWLPRSGEGGSAVDLLFDYYQTYGLPVDVVLDELETRFPLFYDGFGERQNILNEFNERLEKHQEKSRSASAGVFKGGLADHSEEVTRLHTVHHLVLAALQKVIDKNISQKGSNITAERMRMDFNYSKRLSDEEIKKIEDLVNQKIDEDLKVTKKIMPRAEAEKLGAQMEFGKKYPENVSIYFIGPTSQDASLGATPFSVEFCGGPHVAKLSDIGGRVRIIKEEASGAGTRRVYAVVE